MIVSSWIPRYGYLSDIRDQWGEDNRDTQGRRHLTTGWISGIQFGHVRQRNDKNGLTNYLETKNTRGMEEMRT